MIRITAWTRSGAAKWEVDIRLRVRNRRIRVRRKSPYPSKRATLDWAAELLEELRRTGGELAASPEPRASLGAPTVREYTRTYLAASRAEGQRPSTVEAKRVILEGRVAEILGGVPVDQVGQREIGYLRAALVKFKPKTANNYLGAVSGMLKHAADQGVIESAPRVKLLKVPKAHPEFHDRDAYEGMVEAAARVGPRELLVVLLGGEAGLRSGEIAALTTADVEFGKRPCVHVSATLWGGEDGPTKGGRARTVPLTPRLEAALRQVPTPLRGRARIVQRDDGRDVTGRWLQAAIKRVERAAGMPQTGRVHILRHTFCSHLVQAGAHPRVIQQLAGHADLTTTLRYMHLAPDAGDEAIAALSAKRGAGGERAGGKPEKARKRARRGP